MADSVNIVTLKSSCTDATSDEQKSATSNLTALGAYSKVAYSGGALGKNSPVTGAGLRRFDIAPSGDYQQVLVQFWGEGNNNSEAKGRAWALSSKAGATDTKYAMYLGSFDLTLGTADGPHSGTKFIDTIEVTEDKSPTPPGVRLAGAVDNGVAQLIIDGLGAEHIIIEITCQTHGGAAAMTKVGCSTRTA